MFSTLRVGLTVGLGLCTAAGAAVAQQPCATCPTGASAGYGSMLVGSGRGVHPWKSKGPNCNTCSPTINPGSCFGHYRTNWTVWEQACPNWATEGTVIAGPVVVAPPVTAAPAPVDLAPAPKALPPVAPDKEPMKESSKLPAVTAPTPVTAAPKPVTVAPVSVPTNTPGLTLPPVPDLPIGLPPAPPPAGPSKS